MKVHPIIKKTFILKRIGCFLFFLLIFQACYYDNEEELYPFQNSSICDTTEVKYSNQILQIIQTACYSCHDESTQFGNINLEGYTALKTQVDNGNLWGSINHHQGYSAMPRNANKLSDCKIQTIKIWIDEGAMEN